MKKKLLIELFIYVTVVIAGFIMLFTYKPKQNPIDIPSDYKIGSEKSAFISIKQ